MKPTRKHEVLTPSMKESRRHELNRQAEYLAQMQAIGAAIEGAKSQYAAAVADHTEAGECRRRQASGVLTRAMGEAEKMLIPSPGGRLYLGTQIIRAVDVLTGVELPIVERSVGDLDETCVRGAYVDKHFIRWRFDNSACKERFANALRQIGIIPEEQKNGRRGHPLEVGVLFFDGENRQISALLDALTRRALALDVPPRELAEDTELQDQVRRELGESDPARNMTKAEKEKLADISTNHGRRCFEIVRQRQQDYVFAERQDPEGSRFYAKKFRACGPKLPARREGGHGRN